MALSEIGTDPLYRDPALAQFYDLSNRFDADFEFCTKLATNARSVLDLGCGTGELAASLADGRRVVGVDPAAAMLEIARARPGGVRVRWVEGDARTLRLDARFDLIVMTGHAYQVFLTDDDQRAALTTIAAHLAPGGRFVFDSRNPLAVKWEDWTRGDRVTRLDHPELGPIARSGGASHDAATGIVTYLTVYRAERTGEEHAADARIRFTPKERIAELIGECGLAVDEWFGDWRGGRFDAGSREIIPLGRLA